MQVYRLQPRFRKGCAVLEAVKDGIIPESRHKSYCTMYEEAKQIKEWELDKENG